VDQARSMELCEQVLKLAQTYLSPKGNLVMKLFEGPDSEKIAKELSRHFDGSKRFKPEAVRKGSFETYFIGLGKSC
jgi:23S rRNA (uridine2552-2'-O)-methyltransferase